MKNKAANARFIFEEFVMIMKIHSENGETLLSSCNDFLKENEAERILFIEHKAHELHRYYFDELISTNR